MGVKWTQMITLGNKTLKDNPMQRPLGVILGRILIFKPHLLTIKNKLQHSCLVVSRSHRIGMAHRHSLWNLLHADQQQINLCWLGRATVHIQNNRRRILTSTQQRSTNCHWLTSKSPLEAIHQEATVLHLHTIKADSLPKFLKKRSAVQKTSRNSWP